VKQGRKDGVVINVEKVSGWNTNIGATIRCTLEKK
jgi:hypothetical protein